MIRVEVIEQFTLKDYEKIKDSIKRKSIEVNGTLFIGDTFECDEDMVRYLTGRNELGKTVVKIIEVEPEKDNNTIEMEVSFDSKKAINKVNEIKNDGGTYEEAVKEVEKIIDETIKVKPKKKKSNKKQHLAVD